MHVAVNDFEERTFRLFERFGEVSSVAVMPFRYIDGLSDRSICPKVHLCILHICLNVLLCFISICQSIYVFYLSIRPSVYRSAIHLSFSLPIYPSTHLAIHLSIYFLFTWQSMTSTSSFRLFERFGEKRILLSCHLDV